MADYPLSDMLGGGIPFEPDEPTAWVDAAIVTGVDDVLRAPIAIVNDGILYTFVHTSIDTVMRDGLVLDSSAPTSEGWHTVCDITGAGHMIAAISEQQLRITIDGVAETSSASSGQSKFIGAIYSKGLGGDPALLRMAEDRPNANMTNRQKLINQYWAETRGIRFETSLKVEAYRPSSTANAFGGVDYVLDGEL